MIPPGVDVSSPVALALRALQKADQVAPSLPLPDDPVDVRLRQRWIAAALTRTLLIEAMGELGRALGLECSGEDEGDGQYDHSGETCPVHEWLVTTDEAEVEETLRAALSRAGLPAAPWPAAPREGDSGPEDAPEPQV